MLDVLSVLLGKQVWRLISDEKSLLSLSLRAKYYPCKSPLCAMIAHNPSHSWRSIMAGFKVLQKGIIWRVGDGSCMRVGMDNWVPRAANFRVGKLLLDEEEGRKVSEFIDDERDDWDVVARGP